MHNLTFNVDHSRTLDKAVRSVNVAIGTLVVTETDDPIVLKEGETKTYDPPKASLTLYSPKGASVNVTYWDDEEPEAKPKSRKRKGR